VLSRAAKEGRLPLGPFKQINVNTVENELEKLKAFLSHLKVDWKQIFEIEFAPCRKPVQTDAGGWKVPCLTIPLQNGTRVIVEGKITDVTPQGLIEHIKEDPVDVAKVWPVLLVFSCLLRSHELPIANQLVFAKQGKLRTLDFKDPEPSLTRYLEYYLIGMNCVSPLIPDWIPSILTLDNEGFKEVLSNQWESAYKPLYNDYVRWLGHGAIPHSQSILENWQKMAHGLFNDLYFQWFPKLKGKGDGVL
jgi:hypothetical protein